MQSTDLLYCHLLSSVYYANLLALCRSWDKFTGGLRIVSSYSKKCIARPFDGRTQIIVASDFKSISGRR